MAAEQERIKPSQLLTHPLTGRAGLLREIGASHDHVAEFAAWAKGLGCGQIYSFSSRTIPCPITFTSLLYDEARNSIIAGLEHYEGGRSNSSMMVLRDEPGERKYLPIRQEPCLHARVTSMTVGSSRMMLATTKGGHLPSSLYPLNLNTITIRGFFPNLLFASPIYPNHQGTYWASASNPRSDVCSFAVAASNGTTLLIESQGRWTLQQNQSNQNPAETVVIDWLCPNVILKGCRLGAVSLWDTRTGAESSEPRIQHPFAITHVRSINESLVVVAGLQHTLHTYDLRYANRANADRATTQCYDSFPTYRNKVLSHHSLGLDVHRNLVAAATDNRSVQIFDVKRGVELDSGVKNVGANSACVRFVDERMSGEGLKLMVAAGARIDAWGCKGP